MKRSNTNTSHTHTYTTTPQYVSLPDSPRLSHAAKLIISMVMNVKWGCVCFIYSFIFSKTVAVQVTYIFGLANICKTQLLVLFVL